MSSINPINISALVNIIDSVNSIKLRNEDKKLINEEPTPVKSPKRKNRRIRSNRNVEAEEYFEKDKSGSKKGRDYHKHRRPDVFDMLMIFFVMGWLIMYVFKMKKKQRL